MDYFSYCIGSTAESGAYKDNKENRERSENDAPFSPLLDSSFKGDVLDKNDLRETKRRWKVEETVGKDAGL